MDLRGLERYRNLPEQIGATRAVDGRQNRQGDSKAGVKQPAISWFEKRGEVKLSTLAATIKALGGKLEVRAHCSDVDVPISISSPKR